MAGVLCNSLEVSSFARPGARAPRPAPRTRELALLCSAPLRWAKLGAPRPGCGDPERPCAPAARADPQRGLHPPLLPPPPTLGAPGSGSSRGAPGESARRRRPARGAERTRLPAGPRPTRRAHLLEGPRGSRLARRGASVVTASPGRRSPARSLARSRVLLAAAAAAAASALRGGRRAQREPGRLQLFFTFSSTAPREGGKKGGKMSTTGTKKLRR